MGDDVVKGLNISYIETADERKKVLAINSCCKWSLYHIKGEIVKHSFKGLGACYFLSFALNIIINYSTTVVGVLMAG